MPETRNFTMTQNKLTSAPPLLRFTKDFRQYLRGRLEPNADLTISYDADRLTQERSIEGWSIEAYLKFSEAGPVSQITLQSITGITQTNKLSVEPGEGTMVTGQIKIPPDAQEVIIWFVNTGKSGATYYDSNNEQNYVFRFLQEDLFIQEANIQVPSGDPFSRLNVTIAAQPVISKIWLDYEVANSPLDKPVQRQAELAMTGKVDSQGRKLWATQNEPVPHNAVINLSIEYQVGQRTFIDDNDRRQYLIAEKQKSIQAGVMVG
jgi:hypothetical protein